MELIDCIDGFHAFGARVEPEEGGGFNGTVVECQLHSREWMRKETRGRRLGLCSSERHDRLLEWMQAGVYDPPLFFFKVRRCGGGTVVPGAGGTDRVQVQACLET